MADALDNELDDELPEQAEKLNGVAPITAAPSTLTPAPGIAKPSSGNSSIPPLTLRGIGKPSDLDTRTSADENELQRLNRTGSGISQIQHGSPDGGIGIAKPHRVLGGVLRGLETVGDVIAPGVVANIPGTELHHDLLLNRQRGALGQDIGEQEKQANTEHTQAETGAIPSVIAHNEAETKALGEPKPKEEKWDQFPQWTDKDGTPLIREENSGQVVRANDKKPPTGFVAAKPEAAPKTEKVTRIINGVPHEVLINAETGADIKDEGQTKVPGESATEKRSAAESAQVEREGRQNIRKAEGQYRDTQKSVGQLSAAIDQAKDGNGLLTSFVPTMEVLGINAANGVHRISPQEAQAAQLPGGWPERFNAWYDKAASGKISPELVTEGKQLANILLQSSYQRYKSTYDDENGIVSGYGVKDFNKRIPLIPGEPGGGVPKDLGPAPAGKAEGSTGTMQDGTKVVVKGGRLVTQ